MMLPLMGCCLLGLSAARSVQAQTFTFTSSDYNSPTFTNSNGTYRFIQYGKTGMFTATNVPTIVILNDLASANFNPLAKNTDAPNIFTGTASTLLTVTGLGSQTFTQNYTLDGTAPGARYAAFQSAPAFSFLLAGGTQQLLVTPIADNIFRKVSVQVVPFTSTATPEPSQFAAFGLGGLLLGGLCLRARNRKSGLLKAA